MEVNSSAREYDPRPGVLGVAEAEAQAWWGGGCPVVPRCCVAWEFDRDGRDGGGAPPADLGFFSRDDDGGAGGGGGTRTWRGKTARSASALAAGRGTAPALAERRRGAFFATSEGGFSFSRSPPPPLPALLRTSPLLPPLLPLLASSDADRDRRPSPPRDAPGTSRSTEADRDGGVGRRSLAPLLLLLLLPLALTLFLSSSSSLFLLGFVTALPGMRLDAAASPTGARLPHL